MSGAPPRFGTATGWGITEGDMAHLDHDEWLAELRRRLDAMRRTLEQRGEARRRRRWQAPQPREHG